ncbi:MAG: TldD/PmbA family protein [Planctomycetota bacterium]|nr:MAG: TldD/PmbA family protein [Planctomycetota bacterium]
MPLPDQDHALELAHRILDWSSADETEVSIECVEDRFVRYADSGPTQSADRDRYEVGIRVRLHSGAGIREAKATCGNLDPVDAKAALGRAVQLAEVTDPNPELAPLGGPVQVPETAPERPTIDHTFREKADWVKAALDACRAQDLVPAGLIETTAMSRSLISSTGREVQGALTRAAFALTASPASGEGGSGFAEHVAASVEAIRPDDVVRRAVEKAVSNRSPRPIDPGEYTVVLEPAAVSSILLFAAYHGFGAQEVHEQSSFLCGRIGERVFSELLTVEDDAGNDTYPGFLFDGEGARKQRVGLIDRGTVCGPVTDARWARKLDMPNTGHGVAQPSMCGPIASNLVVQPGEASLEDLIRGVDRGLLVSQFHYTNMIEPRDLTLTGMTRNGTFWIEHGEVRHAVRNLRFTEKLVNALARVTGVGREVEVAGALFDGEVLAPALRIERFRFTSTTEF